MDYIEFKDYVVDSFKKIMGGNAHIQLKTIIKNNDRVKEALIVMEGDKKISPSLYLDDYFKTYKKGIAEGEIVSHMYASLRKYQQICNIDTDIFTDFSKIRNCIVYRLVNRDMNRQLLQDVPYVEYLDLAIIFYVIINTAAVSNASAMIHNSHLEMWDVSVEEIYEMAHRNTRRIMGCSLMPMSGLLCEYMEDDTFCTEEYRQEAFHMSMDDISRNMYVLTNCLKLNGASCMLYNQVIKEFADETGTDLYIIPSSVHEVILLPDTGLCRDELNHMICEVNETELLPEEILSDHVYKYERKREAIFIPQN